MYNVSTLYDSIWLGSYWLCGFFFLPPVPLIPSCLIFGFKKKFLNTFGGEKKGEEKDLNSEMFSFLFIKSYFSFSTPCCSVERRKRISSWLWWLWWKKIALLKRCFFFLIIIIIHFWYSHRSYTSLPTYIFYSIRLLLYNHMCFWDNRKKKKQQQKKSIYHNTFSITLKTRGNQTAHTKND